MTMAGITADAALTAGEQKNVQQYHQASPTSVTVLSIDVNNPRDQQSLLSSADNKSSRSRRRRKGKVRGNQVEPDASSPRPRNHYNKKKNSNNSYNNGNGYSNNNSGQQQQSSSFRTPIVTWRGGPRGPRNNNNRYNNNSSSSSSKTIKIGITHLLASIKVLIVQCARPPRDIRRRRNNTMLP
jgi:hypothetical protein